MKVAVVGPGAVGGYYGAKLARSGHDVHFLLRTDYEHVRRHGVQVISPEGDFNVRPRCAREAGQIGVSDLVVVALKSTANAVFPELLPPLVGKETAVLTLQNGLGNEEALAALFPGEQILGGLCFVCLNRTAPGVVRHIAHGKIELGEFNRWPEPRTHDIASAFRHAGVPCAVRDNLAKSHWEKLAWNIPFNGLSVVSCAGADSLTRGEFTGRKGDCLTTDLLLADPRWFTMVRELMIEVISSARAMSLDVEESLADELIARTRIMGAYKPSTMIDFLRGQPVELESLFLEPLRRAQRRGVPAPRLGALCRVLQALENEPS
jgi:2-dehydropantoate 2-reductase